MNRVETSALRAFLLKHEREIAVDAKKAEDDRLDSEATFNAKLMARVFMEIVKRTAVA